MHIDDSDHTRRIDDDPARSSSPNRPKFVPGSFAPLRHPSPDETQIQSDWANARGDAYEPVILQSHPDKAPLAWLVIVTGPRRGKAYRLEPNVTSIGRDPDNHVAVNDISMSSAHAKIRVEKDGYYIHDLVSESRTIVNGVEVTRHSLQDNDTIALGRTTFVFKCVKDDQLPNERY